jgi:serine/threonine protein kinase
MAQFSPLSTLQRLATGATQAAPTSIGRFELKRILGKGAQSVVWMAFDPRLEREVAIKVMRADETTVVADVTRWLKEARSVSRLTHPNIVPVFEADLHDHQPYLVFEYVPGETLAEQLSRQGAMAPMEAVPILLDVLDALGAAHEAGVIHRDLKPSNVLMDKGGRARVMDFGIAASVTQSADPALPSRYAGTPGYMSPEAVTGAAPAPTMDVFSAGVVLAELLMGRPLIAERDPMRAIYRVTHEAIKLPDDLSTAVDDRLRAIILRAIARDPAQRYADARAFAADLNNWLAPADAPATGPGELTRTGGSGTLDFLLRRMRHKSDFPAMSDSVTRIQSIANSEKESVGSLTNEILKDVALTNKLLRLVNSAHYAQGGAISTVSRAVTLVGFNGIRNMALSLVLLDHMHDKAHAQVLKEEYLRSLMAGAIGGQLCPLARDSEEAFIGAMFQNLGRLLAEFYFPEEAQTVRAMVAAKKKPVTEAAACATVLGLSYPDLGLGVAQAWGLPASIQRCMQKAPDVTPSRPPQDPSERIRWIASVANDIADVLLHCEPKEVDAKILALANRYSRIIGVPVEEVQAATVQAREKLIELAQAMELKVAPGTAAARLLTPPALDQPGRLVAFVTNDTLTPHELHATQTGTMTEGEAPTLGDARRVSDILAAGIQDITNAMVEEGFKLSDVLRMILETMYRAMDFQRVIFCMRDAKSDTLTGRFGLGDDVNGLVKLFNVPLKGTTPDLFAAVCLKGADTMISDAAEQRIAERLPAWYRKGVNAPTFLLLPLQIKGSPFGLIYADKGARGGLVLDEKELALLRTLRNQAVMAFRQSS